ncbi:MAG: helix-turn-helix transcriptional regulator [Bacillota bacterium]
MFSNKLRQLREAKGWSKAKLAQKAEISQTYAGELEAGTKQPTLRILKK